MGLTLDPQLIRDLTVLITSSTVGGMAMEALRQPVINGYFIAGSVVGPGGLKLVKVWPHDSFDISFGKFGLYMMGGMLMEMLRQTVLDGQLIAGPVSKFSAMEICHVQSCSLGRLVPCLRCWKAITIVPRTTRHHYLTCQIRHLGACGAEKDVKG